MQPSGHIFFQDSYEEFYEVDWTTVGGTIDMTITTKQPRVWGQPSAGFKEAGILYRKGIITVHRIVFKFITNGYEIIAEGISQFIDFIQMNFPCGGGPSDPFKYHLNNGIVDDCYSIVGEGTRWADPDNPNDADVIWAALDANGNPLESPTVTGPSSVLEFIDVWSN